MMSLGGLKEKDREQGLLRKLANVRHLEREIRERFGKSDLVDLRLTCSEGSDDTFDTYWW
jgi:hypothetical protein